MEPAVNFSEKIDSSQNDVRLDGGESFTTIVRKKFMYAVVFIGLFVLGVVFIPFDLLKGDFETLGFDLILLAIVTGNFIVLKYTKHYVATFYLLLFLVLTVTTIQMYTYHDVYQALGVLPNLPILAFFFFGKIKGILYSVFIIFVMSLVFVLNKAQILLTGFKYDTQEFVLSVVSILLALAFLYFYQIVLENATHSLRENLKQLKTANGKLAVENEAQEEAENFLREEIKARESIQNELKKMNDFMVDREVRMVELKDENKRLQERLVVKD